MVSQNQTDRQKNKSQQPQQNDQAEAVLRTENLKVLYVSGHFG
ncbi:hypothetical protein [Phormidesmis priestleyi]|nr:hypothetical protein [Phormidesmis priestleyi]